MIDSSAKYINNRLYTLLYPTSEYISVWERTLRDYIRIFIIKRYLLKHTTYATELQRKNGLSTSLEAGNSRYNRILKFINNIFGIELARKHSPLSHMIEPIM
ncbi:hypothetical protein BDF21DRAFT_492224 [Thamnidium elegans]|uniref:Uncharacterized protein n=1 Tax=Thamnidium elegans TaxID=101142 RepID=A0A8H7VVE6_9FUNG|nr:hypothetical protein INT48_006319 [Thamnidium elegans]KAI8085503.1 hypothetical protein BDF21DRAFT_492224 [Thamnidium elegans]